MNDPWQPGIRSIRSELQERVADLERRVRLGRVALGLAIAFDLGVIAAFWAVSSAAGEPGTPIQRLVPTLTLALALASITSFLFRLCLRDARQLKEHVRRIEEAWPL